MWEGKYQSMDNSMNDLVIFISIHLIRMNNQTKTKQVLEAKPERRRLQMSRKEWEKYVGEIGKGKKNSTEYAQGNGTG